MTRLTCSQFENGKIGIREHKAQDEGRCFIWDGDVYAVTTDPGRCAKAILLQLKMFDGELRRIRSASYAPLTPEVAARDAALTYAIAKVESWLAEMILLRETGFSVSSIHLKQGAQSK